ncbi:MAG: autotransporter domain-containing protein [Candidatus Algichlamydia australiensis]|nr:autotransporter domain-containing protein [Chlamydiales bacterium]
MDNIGKIFLLFASIGICLFGVDEEIVGDEEVQRKGRGWGDWFTTWTLSEKAEGAYRSVFKAEEWAPIDNSQIEQAQKTLKQLETEIDGLKIHRNALEININNLKGEYEELKEEVEPRISNLKADERGLDGWELKLKNRGENLKIIEEKLQEDKDQYEIDKALLETKLKEEIPVLREGYESERGFYQTRMQALRSAKQRYIPDAKCETTLKQFSYFVYDPLPVSRWLANMSLSSFYESDLGTLFREHQNFIDINSMNRFEIWLEPFGLYSLWDQDGEKIQCRMQAVGFTMGGGVSFADQCALGLGFGYWYTDLRSRDSDEFKGGYDTFVLGPYFNWSFGKGYFGLMLWGGWSDFSVSREGQFDEIVQRTENTHTGWSLAGRAELGYSFVVGNIAANPTFIKPFITFDYYSDFQEAYTEENGSNKAYGAIEIYKVENNRHCNFLSTKAALECKKEYHKHGKGYFIPTATVGWRYLHPLACDDSKVKCFIAPDEGDASDKKAALGAALHTVSHTSYVSNNQIFLDTGFAYIARNGIATALQIEASIGSHYQIYGAEVRLEIGW